MPVIVSATTKMHVPGLQPSPTMPAAVGSMCGVPAAHVSSCFRQVDPNITEQEEQKHGRSERAQLQAEVLSVPLCLLWQHLTVNAK